MYIFKMILIVNFRQIISLFDDSAEDKDILQGFQQSLFREPL